MYHTYHTITIYTFRKEYIYSFPKELRSSKIIFNFCVYTDYFMSFFFNARGNISRRLSKTYIINVYSLK